MFMYLFHMQAGLLGGFVLLFGNEMLLTSYFASCLLTVWVRLVLLAGLQFVLSLFFGVCAECFAWGLLRVSCLGVFSLFSGSVVIVVWVCYVYLAWVCSIFTSFPSFLPFPALELQGRLKKYHLQC